jgi:hypothetical protein
MPESLWRAAIGTQSSRMTVLTHLERHIGPFDHSEVIARFVERNLVLVALSFAQADLVLPSLEAMPLAALLDLVA